MHLLALVVVGGVAGCFLGCGSSSNDDDEGGAGRAGSNASGGRSGATSGGAGSGAGGTGNTGGGSTACGATPCGGNIVGAWQVVQSCTDDTTTTDPACPGGTTSVSDLRQTGTVTFAANGTYTSAGLLSLNLRQTMPLSCLMGDGGSCEILGLAYATLGGTCAVVGTSCECTAAITDRPAMGSGAYTTSGSTYTLTPSQGAPSSGGYCVQGSTLHLHAEIMSAVMGMPGTAASDLVLTRQ